MHKFGLIGKDIDYSFSKTYFTQKFDNLNIDATYENYDIDNILKLKSVLIREKNLKGLNVTIPYKQSVIEFLDQLDQTAKAVGAVNTIKIVQNKLYGYNTDVFGFMSALFPLLEKHHQKALVLGSGGASKAICYALKSFDIDYKIVSRQPVNNQIHYNDINKNTMNAHYLIINCTPLGTYPNIDESPDIPYAYLNQKHFLFDLVYNPKVSTFLAQGNNQGAKICNGYDMLRFQAEKSWEIWNA
ncbi:shikimate dehydrogenase family protein [Mesohalobacter halotolerans]|uniref:Shikimate dehydrogenase n=1 Tax=Mesohalobacter halotolerans TaxID=1883405 RepID=A0A4U5TSZ4_9FLAO|nr:shikimate dehydrogenase [Mesohalobacter halotolerans]MBS3737651.1 shikimate dehydrogenase [Psychroflexus sp.]TKS56584.1 shikimate dehydrogenase [Mesohalobacter halotolerans]